MAHSADRTRAMVDRLPGPTPLGHRRYIRGLMGKPYGAPTELHRSYGPVCGFGVGGRQYVLLFGAEAMVVSDGEDHRRRRALVQPRHPGPGSTLCTERVLRGPGDWAVIGR